MIDINQVTELEELASLKSEYLDSTTAPLDGMWLCGFLPQAGHFSFHRNSRLIGYCGINDDGHLLQFHLQNNGLSEGTSLLADMIGGAYSQLPTIKGAYVSTAEPEYLSQCFDNFNSFRVNAIMYQLDADTPMRALKGNAWSIKLVEPAQLSEAVNFVLGNLEFPEDWLTQYFSNLIKRQELFGCWLEDELTGTGEIRKFEDVQRGYAEVGVIVGQHHRGKGLATWILRQLVDMAIENGLEPICSTERENFGAQKAITRAGFVSRNRIIQFMV